MPEIHYQAAEEMMSMTAGCRDLASRLEEARAENIRLAAHLNEARELLSDCNKEFARLDNEARTYDQSPDDALWKRVNDWLGE